MLATHKQTTLDPLTSVGFGRQGPVFEVTTIDRAGSRSRKPHMPRTDRGEINLDQVDGDAAVKIGGEVLSLTVRFFFLQLSFFDYSQFRR